MRFGLHLPVGRLFTIFGLILVRVGLFGGVVLPERLLGVKASLWWERVQLVVGVLMVFCGGRGDPRA